MHRNAPLTPEGRLRLCLRIEEDGWTVAAAAESMRISRQCAHKWLRRYRDEGIAGLMDRSSRPRSCPHQTPRKVELKIVRMRQREKLGPAQLSGYLGVPASTVHKVLVRHGLNRLAWMDRPTGRVIRRIETSRAEVRLGKARGVHVTAEVTPHHLLLIDEDCEDLDPATRKMNPPLRGTNDRDALLAALVDGTLDCIATDHAPHGASEKELPFEEAPFGVTGLETAFASLHTSLVEPGLVSLETLLERMSAGPARIFGLERPRIAVGAPANLVLLSTKATWRVREDRFRSLSATLCLAMALAVATGARREGNAA